MIWMIFTKILKKYNSNKKCKILIVFDLIAEILSHKKLNVIATELFIRENNLIQKKKYLMQKEYKN